MVIENFEDNLANPYTFHVSIYVMMVTLFTIGYGDFFPVTPGGRIFITLVILYVIVFKIPMQTNELVRLINLKSFYARADYIQN